MLDLLIENAVVVDGTGGPRRPGAVGVKAGRIAAVGDVAGSAETVIDAEGLIVSPGFVDVHTHYDAQVFWDPFLTPSCLHGVTTIIGGHCGFSIAPLNGRTADSTYLLRMLARVEGMPEVSLQQGVPWDWRSFGDFLGRLDGTLALNAGFLVGHSALRRFVMGGRAVGDKASADEIAAMAGLLRRSLEEGGLGFSSSVSPAHSDADGHPVPSRHAGDDEFVALARAVRDHPGTTLEFAPSNTLFGEVGAERVIAMSLAAQRPLNWNPLNPDAARPDIYQAQLAVSDRAAARGARIVPLVMCNPAALRINLETGFLFDAIPGWDAVMGLPLPARQAALRDPLVREFLQQRLGEIVPGLAPIVHWASYTIAETFSAASKPHEGMRVGDVAARLGKMPFETLLDLALADDLRTVFMPEPAGADEESWKLRAQMWKDARTVVGASDAGAHLDMIDTFAFSSNMLGTGMREKALITLEEAVRQLTSVPAELIGLKHRGRIAKGHAADLVIFDPDGIGAGPLYTRRDLPGGAGRLYAEAHGIRHVFVNGVEIVCGGSLTGARPGHVLRSDRDTYTVSLL